MLNHIITKPICKDLAGQRGNRDSRRLAFKNIAEVLEVGIAPADGGMAQLEGGDVGSAEDLVVGIHVTTHAMGAWVANLVGGRRLVKAVEVRGGVGGGDWGRW